VAQAATQQAIVLATEPWWARRSAFACPTPCSVTGYEEQDGIAEWPLSFSPQPSAGNDQWKFTLT
jgi:hypothetical protein